MHPYSVQDTNQMDESQKVHYRIVIAAGLIGAGVTWLISAMTARGFYLGIGAPATIVIYLFIIRHFELKLWKTFLGGILGVTTPDINGEWSAEIKLKDEAGQSKTNTGTVTIVQNWRTIKITLLTDRTSSHTDCASMIMEGTEIILVYRYHAVNRTPGVNDFKNHLGTGRLSFTRNRAGEIDLKRGYIIYYTEIGEKGSIDLRRN
jgi:hypothetical protein